MGYFVVDNIYIPDISGMSSIDKHDAKNEIASVTISVYGKAIQYDSITPDFLREYVVRVSKYSSMYISEKIPDGWQVNKNR